jgi:hypothetical protein
MAKCRAEIHGAQTNEKRKPNKPSSVGSNHTQRAKHVPASDQANQRGSCRCRGATRCSTGSSMSGTGLEPARAPHTTPRRTTPSALPAHQSGSAVLSGARLYSLSAASAAATAVFVQNRTERAHSVRARGDSGSQVRRADERARNAVPNGGGELPQDQGGQSREHPALPYIYIIYIIYIYIIYII